VHPLGQPDPHSEHWEGVRIMASLSGVSVAPVWGIRPSTQPPPHSKPGGGGSGQGALLVTEELSQSKMPRQGVCGARKTYRCTKAIQPLFCRGRKLASRVNGRQKGTDRAENWTEGGSWSTSWEEAMDSSLTSSHLPLVNVCPFSHRGCWLAPA
jgi:hypothetical protein